MKSSTLNSRVNDYSLIIWQNSLMDAAWGLKFQKWPRILTITQDITQRKTILDPDPNLHKDYKQKHRELLVSWYYTADERERERLSITRLKRGAIIHGRWKEVIRRSRNRKLISIRARRGYRRAHCPRRGTTLGPGFGRPCPDGRRRACRVLRDVSTREPRLARRGGVKASGLPRSDCWRAIASSFSALLVFVIFTRRCAGIAGCSTVTRLRNKSGRGHPSSLATRSTSFPFPSLSIPFHSFSSPSRFKRN